MEVGLIRHAADHHSQQQTVKYHTQSGVDSKKYTQSDHTRRGQEIVEKNDTVGVQQPRILVDRLCFSLKLLPHPRLFHPGADRFAGDKTDQGKHDKQQSASCDHSFFRADRIKKTTQWATSSSD